MQNFMQNIGKEHYTKIIYQDIYSGTVKKMKLNQIKKGGQPYEIFVKWV